MYAAYTHRSGRVAEIEYVANDDCRQIDTRQRYTLILLEAGSLTLDVGGHIRPLLPPVFCRPRKTWRSPLSVPTGWRLESSGSTYRF